MSFLRRPYESVPTQGDHTLQELATPHHDDSKSDPGDFAGGRDTEHNTQDTRRLLDEMVRFGDTDRVPNESQRRSITLALALLLLGSVLIMAALWELEVGSSRAGPTVFLASIMLLPGCYYTRIAYHAYRRTPGYRFRDIPAV